MSGFMACVLGRVPVYGVRVGLSAVLWSASVTEHVFGATLHDMACVWVCAPLMVCIHS